MRSVLFLCTVLLASPVAADEPSFNGRPLAGWLSVLKEDPLPRKRRAAAIALGQIVADSPDTRETVLPALGRSVRKDSSPAVRAAAAGVLSQQAGEKAELFFLDTVEALRIEKDSVVRREIAVCLGRLGAKAGPAAQPLSAVLTDPDPTARAAAAEALGRIGAEGRSSAPELIKLASDPDRNARRSAAFALGRIDPENKPTVVIALAHLIQLEKAEDLRWSAASAVGTSALWANNRDSGGAQAAIVSLGLLATPDAPAIEALVGRLTDPDVEVRKLSALSLGKFGAGAKPAEPALTSAVCGDPDRFVRTYALHALATAHSEDPKSILPLLTERLKGDPEFEVRIAVAVEIGGFGPAAIDAVNALREAQRDPQLKVREAAAAALRQVTKPTAPAKP